MKMCEKHMKCRSHALSGHLIDFLCILLGGSKWHFLNLKMDLGSVGGRRDCNATRGLVELGDVQGALQKSVVLFGQAHLP